jgi:hypothetical protein
LRCQGCCGGHPWCLNNIFENPVYQTAWITSQNTIIQVVLELHDFILCRFGFTCRHVLNLYSPKCTNVVLNEPLKHGARNYSSSADKTSPLTLILIFQAHDLLL